MEHLRSKLLSGATVVSTMLVELHTPNIAVLLKACGFDTVIIDCEHGYFDYSMVANVVTAARGEGLAVIVRIPAAERDCITKYMDMGADGLLIPQTDDPETVRRAIDYAKYAPEGRRGVSTTRAHTGYGVADLARYLRVANERTVIMAQIESVAGLERLRDIAAVPGLDALIVGPNDLALDLGHPGELDHPDLQKAISSVATAARESGIRSGIITSRIELLQQCGAQGMSFLSWNSEIGMLMHGARDGLGKLRRALRQTDGEESR